MSYSGRIFSLGSAVVGAAVMLVALVPGPASAAPETPVAYPGGSSATPISGLAFDTCTAPPLSALKAWLGPSPYRTVNIYFGGKNRGCSQPNLTAAWVRDATAMGWNLLPTYMGHQPVCMLGDKPYRYTEQTATARGNSDAADAVSRAKSLGLLPGSALYADVEHYDRSTFSCRNAVRRYVSAWTATVHQSGYLAGVYAHQDSGVPDLAGVYTSSQVNRPDAIWMARWDGKQALTGWPTATNDQWSYWQRAKQYRGDHNETWGGVTLNIDSDSVKAPMATVARSYRVTSTTPLNARSGPFTSNAVVRSYAPGASMPVVCQGLGQKVGTTSVWNRLSNGAWVSDYYTSTPSSTGYSSALPRCSYPGQVTASLLQARTGPGTSYPLTGGALHRGALAYVSCQKAGSLVGTTRVWNRLTNGQWVSDYYVSNRSNTSWSAPVPRCP